MANTLILQKLTNGKVEVLDSTRTRKYSLLPDLSVYQTNNMSAVDIMDVGGNKVDSFRFVDVEKVIREDLTEVVINDNDTLYTELRTYFFFRSALAIGGAMNYKGAWNATTNIPVLIDGTGDVGDFYRVSVAGSQDLGGGVVAYEVNDALIYNGTTWQHFGHGDFILTDGSGTTANGDAVDLGGTITGATVVNANYNNLSFINANNLDFAGLLGDFTVPNGSGFNITTSSQTFNSSSSFNAISENGQVQLRTGDGVSYGTRVAMTTTAGMTVSDYNGLTRGILYGADYSAGFQPRSLVDKAYVDSQIGATTDQSTGVLTGGILSTGAGATQFSISDGTGQLVDNLGVITAVSWSGITNITPANIATQNITFVGINSVGALVEQSGPFTSLQSRTIIVLGVIVHVDRVNVDAVNNEQHIAYNVMSSVYDGFESLGFFNVSGNTYSPNGANLNIDKSVGVMFKMGSNYDTDINDPHNRPLAALTALSFQYRFSDGSSGVTGTAIDPDNLDDGAGGLTAVGNNRWSIHRIYSFTSNNVKIQRGVTDYANLNEAIAERGLEPYITEPSIKANGLLRGWLYVQEGSTALNGATALFEEAPKFGEGGGTVGGAQALYVHPNHSGDVTSVGDGAQTIVDGVVTNAKMADVPALTFKGGQGGPVGPPIDMSQSTARAVIGSGVAAWNADRLQTTPVSATAPLDGQVLTYDTINGWQPEASSGNSDPRLSEIATTVTLNVDTSLVDLAIISAQTTAVTIGAPTGTPLQGREIKIRITDNGTARIITWNAIFRRVGGQLPPITYAGKVLYATCVYNADDVKWDVIDVGIEGESDYDPRVNETTSIGAVTFDAPSTDLSIITAQAIALTVNAPSGIQKQGQNAEFRFKDNGSAQTITWNAIWRPIGVTLPVTTTISKTMYILAKYNTNDNKWDVLAVSEEA